MYRIYIQRISASDVGKCHNNVKYKFMCIITAYLESQQDIGQALGHTDQAQGGTEGIHKVAVFQDTQEQNQGTRELVGQVQIYLLEEWKDISKPHFLNTRKYIYHSHLCREQKT